MATSNVVESRAKLTVHALRIQLISSYLRYRRWWKVMFSPASICRQIMFLYRYVCEQLPGASSSPIVTKLRQSYPWPQGTRWLNLGRSRSLGEVCTLLNALLVADVFWTGFTKTWSWTEPTRNTISGTSTAWPCWIFMKWTWRTSASTHAWRQTGLVRARQLENSTFKVFISSFQHFYSPSDI